MQLPSFTVSTLPTLYILHRLSNPRSTYHLPLFRPLYARARGPQRPPTLRPHRQISLYRLMPLPITSYPLRCLPTSTDSLWKPF
eukprot:2420380-Pleurochrysis_carterae.AAC.1